MKGEEQLREELQEFQREKERIRNIVGQVGGVGNPHDRVINMLLIGIIVGLLVIGGLFNKLTHTLAIQVATLLGVFKLIWMFYESQRANHFQFWILNSLEFRVNEIHKKIKKMEKDLESLKNSENKEEEVSEA